MAGLVEICLEQSLSNFYTPIVNQCQATYTKWLEIRNQYAQHQLSLCLSIREFQVAVMISGGLSNAEAAQKLSCSVANVKKIIRKIYDKLYINNRDAVKRFVMAEREN
ncbi:MAG: LuxR C-terminal-related transcriptional regulator [Anaerolineaceae bacterium]|nr:LuxR C-terminal-related transcriptional regulator [Anaerolineaceae bacterium]